MLEVRDGDSSHSSFIVHDCFSDHGVFVFPYEVEYFSFKVCKELCWNFDGNCLNLEIALVRWSFLLC